MCRYGLCHYRAMVLIYEAMTIIISLKLLYGYYSERWSIKFKSEPNLGEGLNGHIYLSFTPTPPLSHTIANSMPYLFGTAIAISINKNSYVSTWYDCCYTTQQINSNTHANKYDNRLLV
jgi:hypothetical protein